MQEHLQNNQETEGSLGVLWTAGIRPRMKQSLQTSKQIIQ